MSNEIHTGDRVRVGGWVGDVIRVNHFGQSTQYTIPLFEGERPRPIQVPPNTIEKINDLLTQTRARHFDPLWKFHLPSLSNSRTDL